MRTLILLCLLLAPQNSRLVVKYDRIEDKTTVKTKPIPEPRLGLTIVAYFSHPGKTLSKKIEGVGLVIYSHSSTWKYLQRNARALHVLADNERFSPRGPDRKSEVLRDGSVDETLLYYLTLEQLDLITKAAKTEFKLGSDTFTLGNDTVEGFKQLKQSATNH